MGTKVLRDVLADANWGQESLWQADAQPRDGAAQVWAKADGCKVPGDCSEGELHTLPGRDQLGPGGA